MKKMYINGKWVSSATGQTREIINPFNQEVIAVVTEGNKDDAHRAIEAARKAFDEGEWRSVSATQRGYMLYQVAEKVKKCKTELAELETLDTGKTLEESKADMDEIAAVFQYYAGLADKDGGHVIDSPIPDTTSRIVREPVGVCGQITPWNYPLLQASWKLAPALAAGNTVVLKPSEITPLTTIKIAEIFDEIGFPQGVINIVLGSGQSVGAELANSHDVDLISFTGGGTTGRKIMQAASGNFKKISLELGGKNPNIVFDDADFDTAIDYAMNAVFFHAGQVCSAGARLIVHEYIHDQFVEKLVEKVKRIYMGSGFDKETEMGPVISKEHLDKILQYVEIGIEEGAALLVGGKRSLNPDLKNGFFMEPTIFANCHTNMRIVQEEVFGPVATVEKFKTEEEAVKIANSSVYGLAGAVWTQDMNRAERIVKELRMGTTWINDYHPYIPQAPWGGYKQSGIGRELGVTGLEEYTEVKHIFQNINPKPLRWFD
ncbi:betaine-aldehyde dehydrogenase [Alkalihalobacillus sp. BA299]|uniref:betaine-aldehyde dehydrogenase n=1 Tax=Alkalihalobacillus sp. BA299 TaxID=2815938 RepID=UPI001ADA9A6A|nr:betaine-aldehyde dehydrogenase [Alkalihalobacillus sp. BA299]